MNLVSTPPSSDVVIRLPAKLDFVSARRLEDEVLVHRRDGRHVELDLSQTTELSSFGLRVLVMLSRARLPARGSLTLAGVSEQLVSTLEILGLDIAAHELMSVPGSTGTASVLLHRVDVEAMVEVGGYAVRQGSPTPFGARAVAGGVNFAIQSAHATACILVLFRRETGEAYAEIPFPEDFRVGHVFTLFVAGLDPDEVEYGFRFEGPNDPAAGHRFDATQIVLDPYARAISGASVWGARSARRPAYRSVIAPSDFDWDHDRMPALAMEDLIIYEMHIRGFTRHGSSNVRWPGTFAALREKIGYLKSLGVNCIELMPIFEFDELDNPRVDPTTGEGLVNYWGYNTVGFFAPKAGYAATGKLGTQADELKALVKELHAHGIEVLLDVVFNHTGEGNENGATTSFRAIDNRTYYMLGPNGEYLNFSGTGNTLNCNHPVVREMVLDCLRYWVSHYHIDGFRFDLASILGRSRDGEPLANPPLLEALAHDPVLANCKLIAEAWDAAGLYQVGSFPSYGRWAEWNGQYRDTIRRFLKGDAGQVPAVAARLMGSPDLYADRGPAASVNYVTCHDGFTLADLVSYDVKHNDENGEDGQDGNPVNDSWNHGVEGPTSDPAILSLRRRQMKNAVAMLFLSQGVPMILMGDEMGRSQRGNNNPYCHDDDRSWLDWSLLKSNADQWRFCQRMIAFRRAHPALRHSLHSGSGDPRRSPLEVTWHGVGAYQPDWSPASRSIALMLRLAQDGPDDVIYAGINMYWESLTFLLPPAPEGLRWHLFANTGLESPKDIAEPGEETPLGETRFVLVKGRSVVVLVGK